MRKLPWKRLQVRNRIQERGISTPIQLCLSVVGRKERTKRNDASSPKLNLWLRLRGRKGDRLPAPSDPRSYAQTRATLELDVKELNIKRCGFLWLRSYYSFSSKGQSYFTSYSLRKWLVLIFFCLRLLLDGDPRGGWGDQRVTSPTSSASVSSNRKGERYQVFTMKNEGRSFKLQLFWNEKLLRDPAWERGRGKQ
jgi:hypothetical protein